MSQNFHLASSTKRIYDMIPGRYLIAALGLDLKFSEKIIIVGDGPYNEWSVPMLDVSNYYFNSLTDRRVKPK